MVSFLGLLLHVLASPCRSPQARLEAEIVFLRHQLNLPRRSVLSKPKLAAVDQLLFVWLYWVFPSELRAQPSSDRTQSFGGIVLALEVAFPGRSPGIPRFCKPEL